MSKASQRPVFWVFQNKWIFKNVFMYAFLTWKYNKWPWRFNAYIHLHSFTESWTGTMESSEKWKRLLDSKRHCTECLGFLSYDSWKKPGRKLLSVNRKSDNRFFFLIVLFLMLFSKYSAFYQRYLFFRQTIFGCCWYSKSELNFHMFEGCFIV